MSRKRLESQLDSLVSEIVRERDDRCITCNCLLTDWNATAGHYMKRRHRTTRWDLVNVNGQCIFCNNEDNDEKYRQAMVRRYGEEITISLEHMAHQEIHFTKSELKALFLNLKKYEQPESFT